MVIRVQASSDIGVWSVGIVLFNRELDSGVSNNVFGLSDG
jgi:hypothetical protein